MLAELIQGKGGTVLSWAVLNVVVVTAPKDSSERFLAGEGWHLWSNLFLLPLETFFHLLPFKADVPVSIFCPGKRKGRKTKATARVCFGSSSAHSSLDRAAE